MRNLQGHDHSQKAPAVNIYSNRRQVGPADGLPVPVIDDNQVNYGVVDRTWSNGTTTSGTFPPADCKGRAASLPSRLRLTSRRLLKTTPVKLLLRMSVSKGFCLRRQRLPGSSSCPVCAAPANIFSDWSVGMEPAGEN